MFRKQASVRQGSSANNFIDLQPVQTLKGAWNVSFDTAWGGPANVELPQLESWTQRPEDGVRYYSGTARYKKNFDLDGPVGKTPLYLDLGAVKNVAEVCLNGKKLGTLWCAPWRVDISSVVRPTGNVLEVDVTNLWCNRVVHDLSLPVKKRITKTHDTFRFDMLNVNTPILESGLIGPVRVCVGGGGL